MEGSAILEWMTSQRGIGGGFVLSRQAIQISILDVINAVDPIERITSCPLHLKSQGFNLWALHRRLSDATATVEAAFANTSLQELVQESNQLLCSSPAQASVS